MIIPVGISAYNWAASLVVDYPSDNIPLLTDDSKWKEWGNFLQQVNRFANNGSPSTQGFDSWDAWATEFYKVNVNA